MKKFVYADNAATTKINKEVLDAMMPYLTEHYGNPSSIYSIGNKVRSAVETAREEVALAIGADKSEIFFTGGGSESDNWAIRGTALAQGRRGKRHIITSSIEHHAVLHTIEALCKDGYTATYLPAYDNGIVKAEDVERAITDDTALVTVMYANNEIGTIQPVADIGRICAARGVLFHTDAVQAMGNVPIDVGSLNVSLMSVSGHKIGAPKGVGALYMKKGAKVESLITGGGQEGHRRAGTENVASIVGFGKAMSLCSSNIESKAEYVSALRDKLIDGVLKIPRTRLNGDRYLRLCGNANFSIEGIEGESILLMLDLNGICASSGSACTSGSLDPSHVLLSIGLPHEIAHGSLRLSLSSDNTEEDVDYILEILPQVVDRLRAMSPVW